MCARVTTRVSGSTNVCLRVVLLQELAVPALHEEIMRRLSNGDNKEKIEDLIRHGADINQRDPGGLTPLHIATVRK